MQTIKTDDGRTVQTFTATVNLNNGDLQIYGLFAKDCTIDFPRGSVRARTWVGEWDADPVTLDRADQTLADLGWTRIHSWTETTTPRQTHHTQVARTATVTTQGRFDCSVNDAHPAHTWTDYYGYAQHCRGVR